MEMITPAEIALYKPPLSNRKVCFERELVAVQPSAKQPHCHVSWSGSASLPFANKPSAAALHQASRCDFGRIFCNLNFSIKSDVMKQKTQKRPGRKGGAWGVEAATKGSLGRLGGDDAGRTDEGKVHESAAAALFCGVVGEQCCAWCTQRERQGALRRNQELQFPALREGRLAEFAYSVVVRERLGGGVAAPSLGDLQEAMLADQLVVPPPFDPHFGALHPHRPLSPPVDGDADAQAAARALGRRASSLFFRNINDLNRKLVFGDVPDEVKGARRRSLSRPPTFLSTVKSRTSRTSAFSGDPLQPPATPSLTNYDPPLVPLVNQHDVSLFLAGGLSSFKLPDRLPDKPSYHHP